MRIQSLIPICGKTKKYGRPLSWKGQGRAVDLGQALSEDGVKEITIINSRGAAVGIDWNPKPAELLEDWQLVDADTLWKENQHG